MEIDRSDVKRILVIQVGGIGDVILTSPVFTILKKNFQNAGLDFLTSGFMKDLFVNLPEINRVLVYPKPIKSFTQLLKFYFNIYKAGYDLVIDYQCTPGTAQISWFSGASLRLGWKMKRRQWAYNLYSTANVRPEYVAVQKCLALEELGIYETSDKLSVAVDQESQQQADRFFHDEKIDLRKPIVNMTPVGQVQTREWEPEKYVELSRLLIKKYDATVIFSGGTRDKEKLDQLAAKSEHKIRVLPVWPLPVFAAYLSRVDLHYSYDNGPKHMAIAVGIPTLSLFATDPPFLWNPQNDPDHPYIMADVPCNLCRLTRCPLMICMKSISPETVLKEIEKIPALQEKFKTSGFRNQS